MDNLVSSKKVRIKYAIYVKELTVQLLKKVCLKYILLCLP